MAPSLTVALWKWRGVREYSADHVNVFARMVRRHLSLPHRIVCITDDPRGIDECETMPLWDEPRVKVEPGKLNCYRRLKCFAPDAGDWLGERILSLDLDGVIVGDITPLVDRAEDFVIWGRDGWSCPYNGGMWLLRAGTRPRIWTDLDPRTVRKTTQNATVIPGEIPGRRAKRRGILGSDQAWIYYCQPNEATWGEPDGVWRYKPGCVHRLPKGARIVWFPGETKPWNALGRSPWIRDHWL